MRSDKDSTRLHDLLEKLRELPHETEWVEFKQNYQDPEQIGKNISALANSAAYMGKERAYMVWGIEDGTHEIVGTDFNPKTSKKGGELLEPWLSRLLEPDVAFSFNSISVAGHQIEILEIPPATSRPVDFQGQRFIRIGSHTKNLKEYPERERQLWQIFSSQDFETTAALKGLSAEEVLELLDYPEYFDLLGEPQPGDTTNILEKLQSSELVKQDDSGSWAITNLGVILFAKDLRQFKNLERKMLRIIRYKGRDKIEMWEEKEFSKGYAAGFNELFKDSIFPTSEVINGGLRKSQIIFPESAIRELIANALIHQDFNFSGAGPMVEIFENRIEISNPGRPLVEVERILNDTPRSRNEKLARQMRLLGICEEQGSGIDKAVLVAELEQLPAPLFEALPESMKATLFTYKAPSEMTKKERIWASYLHACLKYVRREYLTNASLRERFGLGKKDTSLVSRYIKEAVEAEMIKVSPNGESRKARKYEPFWA